MRSPSTLTFWKLCMRISLCNIRATVHIADQDIDLHQVMCRALCPATTHVIQLMFPSAGTPWQKICTWNKSTIVLCPLFWSSITEGLKVVEDEMGSIVALSPFLEHKDRDSEGVQDIRRAPSFFVPFSFGPSQKIASAKETMRTSTNFWCLF